MGNNVGIVYAVIERIVGVWRPRIAFTGLASGSCAATPSGNLLGRVTGALQRFDEQLPIGYSDHQRSARRAPPLQEKKIVASQ